MPVSWSRPRTTFGVSAVVLEPLSAMSDGFNNHDVLHVVSPGQRHVDAFAVTLLD